MVDSNGDCQAEASAAAGRWEQVDLLGALTPLPPTAPPEPAPALVPPAADMPVDIASAEDITPTENIAPAETAPGEAPAAPAMEPSAPPALAPLTAVAAEPPIAARPAAVPATLLILDTETTGLAPADSSCIEVGAVLFSVPQRAVLMQVSFLIPCASNPAVAINGIDAATTRLPQPWRAGLACFQAMAEACEAVVAHNAGFDRQWFGLGELPPLQRPWICSMEDIRWPADRQLRPAPSVRDLALAYGVPVWAAHRALTDCIYIAQVFERCTDLEALLAAALEPRLLYRACLSYDDRQQARDAGFRWNDPVPRAWSRRLSQREVAALPFPVEAVAA